MHGQGGAQAAGRVMKQRQGLVAARLHLLKYLHITPVVAPGGGGRLLCASLLLGAGRPAA
ncbi:hypothetical protein GCM10008019_34430 [Deinococcus soli (ex Cha et al. 2016)]|nr:hypothetical protein GCM10008019_34430 [Deinococcus soli (ex Cha et al. 2016)]